MMAAEDIDYTYDTGKCILKKSPTVKPYDYTVGLIILTQLSLSSELIVALLETEQGSQATVYTREAHEGKTQESCCYHDNGDTLHALRNANQSLLLADAGKDNECQGSCPISINAYDLYPHTFYFPILECSSSKILGLSLIRCSYIIAHHLSQLCLYLNIKIIHKQQYYFFDSTFLFNISFGTEFLTKASL